MKHLRHTLIACIFSISITRLSAQTNTFPSSGNAGIGTTSPAANLDVGDVTAAGALKTVFARQTEGNTTGSGTFLGVKSWGTQVADYNGKMFSIEDTFYGYLNSSIEFYRGGSTTGGYITFTTGDGTERLRIDPAGNIGIGTTNPTASLQVGSSVGNQGLKVGVVGNMANANAEIRNSLAVLAYDATVASSMGAVAWNYYNGGDAPSWSGTLLTYFGSSYSGSVYGLRAANQGTLVFQNVSNGVISSNGANIYVSPLGNVDASFLTNGNVGIGTVSPSAKLDVAGGSQIDEQLLYVRHIEGKNWNDASTVGDLYLQYNNNNNDIIFNNSKMVFRGSTGYLGIGTTNPTYPLSVNGTIEAKEVIVQTGWSDYVFDEGYRLAPLSEVEQHIKAEKHLPGIPSAKDVAEHGVDMGAMQAKLLAKVEELTLHLIEQERQLALQQAEISELRSKLSNITDRAAP